MQIKKCKTKPLEYEFIQLKEETTLEEIKEFCGEGCWRLRQWETYVALNRECVRCDDFILKDSNGDIRVYTEDEFETLFVEI